MVSEGGGGGGAVFKERRRGGTVGGEKGKRVSGGKQGKGVTMGGGDGVRDPMGQGWAGFQGKKG